MNVINTPNSVQPDSVSAPTLSGSLVTAKPIFTTTPKQQHDQTTLNIIFGVFAVVLAFIALIIGYLQLRRFKRQSNDDNAMYAGPLTELTET